MTEGRLSDEAETQMKLQLTVGDWATLAFFALAVVMGCYTQPERELPASTVTKPATTGALTSR